MSLLVFDKWTWGLICWSLVKIQKKKSASSASLLTQLSCCLAESGNVVWWISSVWNDHFVICWIETSRLVTKNVIIWFSKMNAACSASTKKVQLCWFKSLMLSLKSQNVRFNDARQNSNFSFYLSCKIKLYSPYF